MLSRRLKRRYKPHKDIQDKLDNLREGTVIMAEATSGTHATDVATALSTSSLVDLYGLYCPRWSYCHTDGLFPYMLRAEFLGVGLKVPEVVKRPDQITQKDTEDLLSICRAKNWEGLVLKETHHRGWWKLKVKQTLEAVVTSYKISTSQSFSGGLQSLEVSLYRNGALHPVADVGSGYPSSFRMTCNPRSLIGQVAEIEYDCLAKLGRLKSPRFVGFRPDKSPEDCTWETQLGASHEPH